ncbi:thiamine pyrophosphate-dependent dehydrogenase E1 component subunit alpha [Mesorhizobium sp. M0204]|uniref:thiamine pyrophosphate-dependent dehydrogenase E1 component subunit alpha n=1 Tax=Mesorhizobium sp. M0204 TaxID=2956913 RepID=UPI00333B9F30
MAPNTFEQMVDAYRSMQTIRAFEERLAREAATTPFVGPLHLYSGAEGSAVGVCMNLDTRDRVYSTHRPHGHCVARGVDIKALMLEIYGRQGGVCNGKGGSMHLADPDVGLMGANAIVSGAMPLVCGAALAAKTLRTGGVAVGFTGDGGSNQGQFLESLNFASVFKLPAIFVIEDNGFAETTASSWSCAGDHVKRAEGFGMPGRRVDGSDVFDVYDAVREAVERARLGDGPSLLDIKVERFHPHEEGVSDAMRLREQLEWAKANRDPIKNLKARMLSAGAIKQSELEEIDRKIERLIDEAVVEAKAAPPIPVSQLLTDVYHTYP